MEGANNGTADSSCFSLICCWREGVGMDEGGGNGIEFYRIIKNAPPSAIDLDMSLIGGLDEYSARLNRPSHGFARHRRSNLPPLVPPMKAVRDAKQA